MLMLTCALKDSPPFRSHSPRQVADEVRRQLVIGNRRSATGDWRLEIGDWRSMSGDRRLGVVTENLWLFEETAIFVLVHAWRVHRSQRSTCKSFQAPPPTKP